VVPVQDVVGGEKGVTGGGDWDAGPLLLKF
jgi:hypothetical protein